MEITPARHFQKSSRDLDLEKIAPFEFVQKKIFGSFYRVSYETDATFFRIDLSLLVFELWAFEVFDFIKGFGLRKILTRQICTKNFFWLI